MMMPPTSAFQPQYPPMMSQQFQPPQQAQPMPQFPPQPTPQPGPFAQNAPAMQPQAQAMPAARPAAPAAPAGQSAPAGGPSLDELMQMLGGAGAAGPAAQAGPAGAAGPAAQAGPATAPQQPMFGSDAKDLMKRVQDLGKRHPEVKSEAKKGAALWGGGAAGAVLLLPLIDLFSSFGLLTIAVATAYGAYRGGKKALQKPQA